MPEVALSPRLTIHYLDPQPSNSPVVLLLHGLGVNGESWGLQIPALIEAGYRPIAPDGRGFGKSSYPGGLHKVSDMAADTARLLDHLQIASAHVVGISMGGTLALQLALDHPQRVQKLILVNTFASLRPDRPEMWGYFLFRALVISAFGLEMQAKLVARRAFPNPDDEPMRRIMQQQICQAHPWGYRASMLALGRFNVVRRLGEIKSPTLVITGAEDNTVAPKNQRFLAERIPGARQVIIPNAGHPVTGQQAEKFNQIMLEFFSPAQPAGKQRDPLPRSTI